MKKILEKMLRTVSVSLLLISIGMLGMTTRSDEETVVPNNWVTMPTESLSIGYEGGELTAYYQLAAELDTGYVYVVNEETWCAGYIQNRQYTDIDTSSSSSV